MTATLLDDSLPPAPTVEHDSRAAPLNPDAAGRRRRELLTLGVAALLTLPLLGQLLLPLFGSEARLPPLVQLALAAPVQFWAGARFYRAGWAALRRSRGDRDLLVALGTSAAFGLSLVLTLAAGPAMLSWQGPQLHYEAAAAVVTLVLLGRVLEARARDRIAVRPGEREAADALGSRRPVQRLVDRIGAVFVPAVVAVAAATLAGWLLAGAAPSTAILHAVAVLVVAGPAALALAAPAAILVGLGVAARRGLLIADSAALEVARRLDTVVFDKTGTLTLGRPALVETLAVAPGGEAELLRLLASAQQGSAHPLAGALLVAAREAGLALSAPAGFRALAGRGIEAEVEGRRLLAGTRRLLAERGVGTAPLEAAAGRLERRGLTLVWVALEGGLAGLLALGDALRPGAADAVTALQARGLEVVLLTGDSRRTADAVATAAGIPRVLAEVPPERKAGEIARLQGEGRRVAMVGDGVKDAPALARAELGIVLGGGSEATLESAPVALLRADPLLVAETVDLARAIRGKIADNLFWAFAYNAVAIPIAVLGYLSPAVAGAAMALSSVAVIGNARLLERYRSRVRRD